MTDADLMMSVNHTSWCSAYVNTVFQQDADNFPSISKIREDVKTLTTFLTARVAPWSEVAGTYTMDFGRVLTHSTTRKMMKKRDLISDVKKTGLGIVKDTVNGATNAATGAVKSVVTGAESVEEAFKELGTADITKSVTINVGIGTPALRTNIVTSVEWVLISLHNPPSENLLSSQSTHIKIDCIDCYITGTFQVSGRIVVSILDAQVDSQFNITSRSRILNCKILQ